ncbi:hypothetical protein D3C81_1573880 [compost metagenome]
MDRGLRGQRRVAGRPVRGRRAHRHAAGTGPGAGLRGLPHRAVARRRNRAGRLRQPAARALVAPRAGGVAWLGGDARRRARAARRHASPHKRGRGRRRAPPPASADHPYRRQTGRSLRHLRRALRHAAGHHARGGGQVRLVHGRSAARGRRGAPASAHASGPPGRRRGLRASAGRGARAGRKGLGAARRHQPSPGAS